MMVTTFARLHRSEALPPGVLAGTSQLGLKMSNSLCSSSSD